MKWVLRTSTVRVATSEQDQVYRSIQDAPPELREKIREAIDGPDSETIFIANQEAYEQIVKKARDLPSELRDVSQSASADDPSAAFDHRLTKSARRAVLAIFGSIAALWMIWAWLIQIGK